MRYIQLPQQILFLDVMQPNHQVFLPTGDLRYSRILELMQEFERNVEEIRDVLLFKNFLKSGDLKVLNNILYFKKFPIPEEIAIHLFSKEYSEEQFLVICNLWVSLFTRLKGEQGVKIFERAISLRDMRPITKDGTVLVTPSYIPEDLRLILSESGMVFLQGEGNNISGTLDNYFETLFGEMGKPLFKDFLKVLRSSKSTNLKLDTVEVIKVLVTELSLTYDYAKLLVSEKFLQLGDFTRNKKILPLAISFIKNFWSEKKIFEQLIEHTAEFKNFVNEVFYKEEKHKEWLFTTFLPRYFVSAPKFSTIEDLCSWFNSITSRIGLSDKILHMPLNFAPWVYLLSKCGHATSKKGSTLNAEGSEQSGLYTLNFMTETVELGHYGNYLGHCMGQGKDHYTVNAAASGTGIFALLSLDKKPLMTGYWKISKKHEVSLGQISGNGKGKGNGSPKNREWIDENFTRRVTNFISGASFLGVDAAWSSFKDLMHVEKFEVGSSYILATRTSGLVENEKSLVLSPALEKFMPLYFKLWNSFFIEEKEVISYNEKTIYLMEWLWCFLEKLILKDLQTAGKSVKEINKLIEKKMANLNEKEIIKEIFANEIPALKEELKGIFDDYGIPLTSEIPKIEKNPLQLKVSSEMCVTQENVDRYSYINLGEMESETTSYKPLFVASL